MSNIFIQEIEQQAKELGVDINILCDEAGIARSTISRQKAGKTKGGNMATFAKLKDALTKHQSKKVKNRSSN